jgi:proline iminopeptidase
VPEVSLEGTTFYYEEVGRGVPCIALHGGLGFDHQYMKTMLGPLEHSLRVVYLDQRGNGRSGRPPLETITMQQLADDVDALRDRLNLERVALVGHSYGGFVALECALRYPDRISHLVLVDTGPGAFEPTEEELAERADPSWISPAIANASWDPPHTDDDFARDFPKIAARYVKSITPEVLLEKVGGGILSASALLRSAAVLEEWSVADRLGEIACPSLVICGRYDLVTTPECAKRMATAIPGAELRWFESSGHFPWLEEPDEFAAALRDFIGRHPS